MDGWKGCIVKGSVGLSMSFKVKMSKHRMKKWMAQFKKKVFSLKGLEVRIADIDSKSTAMGWSDTLYKERINLLNEI